MKNKGTVVLTLLLLSIFLIQGCKKDESPAPSKVELLTGGSGKWKLTGQKVTAAGQTEDVFSSLDVCEADNIFYYKSDLTYQVLEGATKCDSSDPEVYESGTWSFDSNQTHLTSVASGDAPETVVVSELTNTKLVVKLTISLFGQSLDIESTYTKQ